MTCPIGHMIRIRFFPPSLDEWLSKGHPARVFSEILDRIGIKGFRDPQVRRQACQMLYMDKKEMQADLTNLTD